MLLDAASFLNLDLAASWMIGDSEIDIQPGKAPVCKTARLLADSLTEGPVGHDRTDSTAADVSATSLLAVISLILHFGHS
jgi:histidinol phosphatase-like enzyme